MVGDKDLSFILAEFPERLGYLWQLFQYLSYRLPFHPKPLNCRATCLPPAILLLPQNQLFIISVRRERCSQYAAAWS